MARKTQGDPVRQWPGISQWQAGGMGQQAAHPAPVHSARQAATECLCGSIQSDGQAEWLDQHLFESIAQAQDTATKWLWSYNNQRPNMAPGGISQI